MFELRPSQRIHTPPSGTSSPLRRSNFLAELRRQSRVFVDDSEDEEGVEGFGDAGKRYDVEEEAIEDDEGDFGTGEGHGAAPGAEEYGEGFGDDEDDGVDEGELQSAVTGLGLQ